MLESGRELDRSKRRVVSLQAHAEAIFFSQDNLPVGAAFGAGLVYARQNGLLTSSAIDDQQVPISRSSRSLRAASSRRERTRARQIRTVERIFRTRTTNGFINALR
jgi:hypothetical protein